MAKAVGVWLRDGCLVYILEGTGKYHRTENGIEEQLQNKLMVNVSLNPASGLYYQKAEELAEKIRKFLNETQGDE